MKKGLCLILCTAMILAVSGCWSRKEPKTMAIVNSVIYDYIAGEGYRVTTEVMNPAALGGGDKGGGSGKSPNITTISVGPSVPEGIRNASKSLDQALFGGHNKVRFLSERFARKDMTSLMDYILRDHLTDENPLVVIIKGEKPEMIYSCTLGISDTVGDYMENLSESQPNVISTSVFVSNLDFIKDYYDDGIQPVAGLAEIVECDEKPSTNEASEQGSQTSQSSSDKTNKINYEGLAAFKGGQLVGYMNGTETRAYNFITNNIETAPVSIPSGDDFTVALVKGSNADIQTTVEGDQIKINVQIKAGLSIVQEGATIDVSQMEPLKAVEDGFNKLLITEIAAAIQKAQTEFRSDIFGFGKAVHDQHPEKWREIKDNWDDYFSKATVSITVESTVDRSGQIKEPFEMED